MLTKGQANYLAKVPDDQKMVVKPFNPRGLEIANQVIAEIKEIEPELEVILLGSLPLKILGQEDIDISAFCIKSEQSKHIDNFKKLFGEPNRGGINSVGWDFQREGFSVSVWLTDPTVETTKQQVAIFNLLKNNPELLEEYAKIKEEAQYLPYKEYQKRKYVFFNRILGIKALDPKEELEKIGLNPDNSVVIGSGILSALGIRESKDIDLVVDQENYNRLKSDGHFKKETNHVGTEILTDDVFEIGVGWNVLGKNWMFNDFLDKSEIINGVRYHTLEFLLEVKRSWLKDSDVRQKDFDDVKLIEDYLKNKK